MTTSKKITIAVLIIFTVVLAGVSLFIALQINRQPDTSVADGCSDSQTRTDCNAPFEGKFVCLTPGNGIDPQAFCRDFHGTGEGGTCSAPGQSSTCKAGLSCCSCGKCGGSSMTCNDLCGSGGTPGGGGGSGNGGLGSSCTPFQNNCQSGLVCTLSSATSGQYTCNNPGSGNTCSSLCPNGVEYLAFTCSTLTASGECNSNGQTFQTAAEALAHVQAAGCGQVDTVCRGGSPGNHTACGDFLVVRDRCGGGGGTTPDPTGITVGGRVVCAVPGGENIQMAGVTITVSDTLNTDTSMEPRVRTAVTDAQGRFTIEYPSATNVRQYKVEVTALPTGSLPNGQPYSALTGPNPVNCNNSTQLASCQRNNTDNRNFCTLNTLGYRQCDLRPGEAENNFRFEYTNCLPTPVCGGDCTTNAQCPNNHQCQTGKCVLNTCATDPSLCQSDRCTLLPDANCGGTCTSNTQCPNNHTCSSGRCVLTQCTTNPAQCSADLCTVLPPTTCGGTCSQTSQCPTNHTCSSGRCILNACMNNPSCTNNGCTLPATALFDDQTDMVLIGLLLVLGGLVIYQLNGYQLAYNFVLRSDAMKFLLLDKENPLRKEAEERSKLKDKNKKRREKEDDREGFERRFQK